MKAFLETTVPRIITELTSAKLILPATSAAPAKRPRMRGPVPIPFYGGPAPHSHDHVEIAIVIEGPLYSEIERRGRIVEAGSVILFPSRVLHYDSYVAPETRYTTLWYVLWPGRPRVNLSRYTPHHGFELVSLYELRQELIPEDDLTFAASLTRTARPGVLRVRELLFALYAASLEAVRRSGSLPPTEVVRKVVSDAVAFLREHLAQAPTVEMAADFVGLSPTYLTTVVRMELGSPLHDVLAELRLEKSKELLSKTNRSVKEIAHLSGFSSADYFSRAFHRATAMSPRQYRKQSVRR